MDKKFSRQYGEEILCYRLRTRRSKKRAQYEDFHKQLIQLYNEERALSVQKQNLGWEPLTPPVQKGWKRVFVLRQDVARSRQADFYTGILARINTMQWSASKDFLKKKRALGRKKYVPIEQHLLKPDEYRFQKCGFTAAEKQQFHEGWYYEKGGRRFVKRYVFNEPWRFVLKISPNMIEKVRKQDPALDARLSEIKRLVERNDYRGTQTHLLHGCDNRRWKTPGKNARTGGLENKPLQRILDELNE